MNIKNKGTYEDNKEKGNEKSRKHKRRRDRKREMCNLRLNVLTPI